ncbi:amino acid ABC transporter permease [Consotaella salsifontis]|uniref:General L-amino acid ABC transporter membrane protein n=1 Tax=Consotaella salsifontis TaxID=1365950 RepID=A0A1T4L6V8_9HYPH|nr:amino acid ABC transporter permease [Consotaella salsifontis]SJZ50327.1 general L-amino acid ABC transporter membrane protein [Consotaella salsifontis]
MEEHVTRYVSEEFKQPLPPPADNAGIIGTARKNLFATPLDAAISLVTLLVVVWAVWNLLGWALFDAVFSGSDRTACVATGDSEVGACWIFVSSKFLQFIYGLYPDPERWRVNTVFALLAILTAGLLIPSVPKKGLNAALLLGVFPFVAFVLLTGGRLSFSGGQVAFFAMLAAFGTLIVVPSRSDLDFERPLMRAAAGLAVAAVLALLLSAASSRAGIAFLGLRFTAFSLSALVLSALSILSVASAALQRGGGGRVAATALLVPVLIAAALAVLSVDFGLPEVPTHLWGGLLVTLVVSVTGIATSLPLGILLALGRRSDMPAVRLLSVIFIEFWRGVPLITVLFMAQFMLPLFMPDGVSFNQLLRALVGVALFSAAYMAEVVRGGLQAIRKGQYEAADAMALSYWQKMRLIILPQALKLVIPGIVNTFIGLFKDTSLVYIIGLADLLGTVRRGFNDPNWITPSTPATGLVFAAFIYWLFCFGMSRYSIFMERRLDTGHK